MHNERSCLSDPRNSKSSAPSSVDAASNTGQVIQFRCERSARMPGDCVGKQTEARPGGNRLQPGNEPSVGRTRQCQAPVAGTGGETGPPLEWGCFSFLALKCNLHSDLIPTFPPRQLPPRHHATSMPRHHVVTNHLRKAMLRVVGTSANARVSWPL